MRVNPASSRVNRAKCRDHDHEQIPDLVRALTKRGQRTATKSQVHATHLYACAPIRDPRITGTGRSAPIIASPRRITHTDERSSPVPRPSPPHDTASGACISPVAHPMPSHAQLSSPITTPRSRRPTRHRESTTHARDQAPRLYCGGGRPPTACGAWRQAEQRALLVELHEFAIKCLHLL